MFFDKEKNTPDTQGSAFGSQISAAGDGIPSFLASGIEAAKGEQKSTYSFYKPDPVPKELISVLKSMLQRLFPDTRKAFLLEAKQNNKKGYLMIVDIDSKFLKIINIYLDSETKRVRGDVPIECVLYSKSSAALVDGVEPFYFREVAESEEPVRETKKESVSYGTKTEVKKPDIPVKEVSEVKTEVASGTKDAPLSNAGKTHTNQTLKRTLSGVETPKTNTKVKPSTKAELYGLLNEYGVKKTGTVSTVATAAIREFEFYVPFTGTESAKSGGLVPSLPIDDKLRFKILINPETEEKAVPLFTQEEDAVAYSKKDNCFVVRMKYKDFSSSRAFEITKHDGIVINPDEEGIFMPSSHPLLAETK